MKKYIFAGVAVAVLATSVLLISQQATQSSLVEADETAPYAGSNEPSDPNYTGTFEYGEAAKSDVGSNPGWQYTLKVYQTSPTQLKADLDIDGFQTITRITGILKAGSKHLEFVFDSYRPDNINTPFSKGDILLFLTEATNKSGVDVSSYDIIWNKLKSNLVNSGKAEFKRKSNPFEQWITDLSPTVRADLNWAYVPYSALYRKNTITEKNPAAGFTCSSYIVGVATQHMTLGEKEGLLAIRNAKYKPEAQQTVTTYFNLGKTGWSPAQSDISSGYLYPRLEAELGVDVIRAKDSTLGGAGGAMNNPDPADCKDFAVPEEYKKVSASGINGYVHIGPTCPVERVPADPNCADKPLANAKIAISGTNAKYDAFADPKYVTTDDRGYFTFVDTGSTFPHNYLIEFPTSKSLPRCPDTKVTIKANQFTTVNIRCDSGIR